MVASVAVALAVTSAIGSSLVAPARVRAVPSSWFLPLRFHVVAINGQAAVQEPWIDAQVDAANRVFAPWRVSFVDHEREVLRAQDAHVRGARDMVELAGRAVESHIDVFVVLSLRTRHRRALGVCVCGMGRGIADHIVIATESDHETLGHEIGHYFGLDHSRTPGNIMWPYAGRGLAAGVLTPPFFAPSEGARITARVTQLVWEGRAMIVPPP